MISGDDDGVVTRLGVPGGGGPDVGGRHRAVVLVVPVCGLQVPLAPNLQVVPIYPLGSIRLASHAEVLRGGGLEVQLACGRQMMSGLLNTRSLCSLFFKTFQGCSSQINISFRLQMVPEKHHQPMYAEMSRGSPRLLNGRLAGLLSPELLVISPVLHHPVQGQAVSGFDRVRPEPAQPGTVPLLGLRH